MGIVSHLTRVLDGPIGEYLCEAPWNEFEVSRVGMNDDEVAAASGDLRLLDAWAALGVATFDTNQDPAVDSDA